MRPSHKNWYFVWKIGFVPFVFSTTAQYLGGLLKVKSEFWIFWPKCELLIIKISGNQIKVAILALK